jgi:hypothetical protein
MDLLPAHAGSTRWQTTFIPEFFGETIAFRSWDIRKTGDRHRKNCRRGRRDIDILAVVTAQQGQHVSRSSGRIALRPPRFSCGVLQEFE